jgi:hypothetical protein
MAETIAVPANHTMKIVAFRRRAQVCRMHLAFRASSSESWLTGFRNDIAQNVCTELPNYQHVSLRPYEILCEAFVCNDQDEWGMGVDRSNRHDQCCAKLLSGPWAASPRPLSAAVFLPTQRCGLT